MDSMKLVPYIEEQALFDYAASCAKAMSGKAQGFGKHDAAALRRALRQTEKCHSLLSRRYGDAAHVPAACEWLLDNRYMIQREYPDTYAQLKNAPRQRLSRGGLLICELCRALLQCSSGKIHDL